MSKQPRDARDKMERLRARSSIIRLGDRDPRQRWLIVRRDPDETGPGEFFVTHGANEAKFAKRKNFEILGFTYDRGEATALAHRATLVCGPNYQPKHSAHKEKSARKAKATASDPLAAIPDAWDELKIGPAAGVNDLDITPEGEEKK